jgi:Uma2 family endonuclease
MPKPLHHDVVDNIYSLLKEGLQQSSFKAGTAINMDMRADHSMPVPDVWVMEKTRWRAALEENAYPKGSPDLAIEVMSRANTRARILQKVRLYLKNGSKAVWAVFPKKKRIEAYYPNQEKPSVHEGVITTPQPLPGVHLQLAAIFKIE